MNRLLRRAKDSHFTAFGRTKGTEHSQSERGGQSMAAAFHLLSDASVTMKTSLGLPQPFGKRHELLGSIFSDLRVSALN